MATCNDEIAAKMGQDKPFKTGEDADAAMCGKYQEAPAVMEARRKLRADGQSRSTVSPIKG